MGVTWAENQTLILFDPGFRNSEVTYNFSKTVVQF
jgi:hypothetical protein